MIALGGNTAEGHSGTGTSKVFSVMETRQYTRDRTAPRKSPRSTRNVTPNRKWQCNALIALPIHTSQ
jgi:hypothetical protein